MAVFRCDFGGSLYTDIWQCTLHFEHDGPFPGPIDYTATLADLKTDLSTWFTAGGFTQASKLSYVKFNEIDPVTKKYVSQTDSHTLDFTPVTGTSANNIAPQLSMCVGLRTAAVRGVAARGRIFPPPQSVSLDANGFANPATITAALTNHKTLINNLNNWPGPDWGATHVVVLGYTGATRKVTGVEMGNVEDTQRRRRNALHETRTYQAVA